MIRKIIAGVLCLVAGISILYSCKKNNAYDLGGGASSCDTTDVSYASTVASILSANCVSCHGTGNASGGVNLSTYSGVYTVAMNGKLLGSINHASGYSAMPQGAAKLDVCTISKITAWIQQGAKNN